MKHIVIFIVFLSTVVTGQNPDTLSFYSEAFKEKRTVFVHKPGFNKYASDSVKFPVIYLLDGQHDWFIEPTLSNIKYLQYTHEIPNVIVVVIPLKNRVKESRIIDLKTKLPLDEFITKDLEEKLKKYNPNDFRMIIGHSFSASFSLYSYYSNPNFYSAVIANTPLDKMEMLVKGFTNSNIDKTKISISIGGAARSKDFYHRKNHTQLKTDFPIFYKTINTFDAEYSKHSAVPIVAVPFILTKIFRDFSDRYTKIAEINVEYKLKNKPETVKKEMFKILKAAKIENFFYPPEIAEINGIASRYANSGYNNHATKVYELGIKYYPNYYQFYLSLYDFLKNEDVNKAKKYLNKAELLLHQFETDWEGKKEELKIIENEKIKNKW